MPAADGTLFRVWAQGHNAVDLVLRDHGRYPMAPEGDGFFALFLDGLGPGTRYSLGVESGPPLADPVSRFQPAGPFGWSEVIDPKAYRWTDEAWPGARREGQVICEVHVGTFTPEGTWEAAAQKLPLLRDTGFTMVELLPVADFPGRFNWGYDGVNLFAPSRHYGRPDAFRAFVDKAHGLGIAVILDVVYNHLPPQGSPLPAVSGRYVSELHETEWGAALNFDGPDSDPVRAFVLANVRHWIGEYHLDGLRLDAVQDIRDDSPEHIVGAIVDAARQAAGGRSVFISGENEPQKARVLRPRAAGGFGLDAVWSEDFHHSALVALTGRRPAYCSDHRGRAQELLSACKRGFLFQGQRYGWQDQPRGEPVLDQPPAAFVAYLENHDQVANTGTGTRLHARASPARMRAMTALQLLSPTTPLLFQGQDFASTRPFVYFADPPEGAEAVAQGRLKSLSQFPALTTEAAQAAVPAPSEAGSFLSCKLDWSERDRNATWLRLHRDLIALRRTDPVLALQGSAGFDGAVLGEHCFLARYFNGGADERLLLVNLGEDLALDGIPEPLFAPPAGECWHLLWSSERPAYGGSDTLPLDVAAPWLLTADTTLLMRSKPTVDPAGGR